MVSSQDMQGLSIDEILIHKLIETCKDCIGCLPTYYDFKYLNTDNTQIARYLSSSEIWVPFISIYYSCHWLQKLLEEK